MLVFKTLWRMWKNINNALENAKVKKTVDNLAPASAKYYQKTVLTPSFESIVCKLSFPVLVTNASSNGLSRS